MMKLFPGRTWWSIEGRARQLGLRRPEKEPISSSLFRTGDVGFSAGMIIADGSVIESWISAGSVRSKLEGGGVRPNRYYTMPQVQVSMEDKASLDRLARMWGARVNFCQKSSVGNDVWKVCVHGTKAYDLLKLVLPYLAGEKREKALYLLKKYRYRKSFVSSEPKKFVAFGGMK
ncbi:MAG: hypothetical protein LYZ69_06740 [Nitrososphaerales archaeon]|nr:hypothetical protein [Nitrososphaerales archaeon]